MLGFLIYGWCFLEIWKTQTCYLLSIASYYFSLELSTLRFWILFYKSLIFIILIHLFRLVVLTFLCADLDLFSWICLRYNWIYASLNSPSLSSTAWNLVVNSQLNFSNFTLSLITLFFPSMIISNFCFFKHVRNSCYSSVHRQLKTMLEDYFTTVPF